MAPSDRPLPVQLTRAATDDLRLEFSYLEERDRSAARATIDKLEDAFHRLGEFPEMGPLLPTDGCERLVRFLVVEPYIIFYREPTETVVVLRILHSRQDSLGMLLE